MVDETTGETVGGVDLEALTRPFPSAALQSRRGGGGMNFTYVDGTTVIHRLIEATNNNFSFAVDRYWSEAGARYAIVTLTLPGIGSRSHIGVQAEQAGQGEDALAKGAITDALKKAATLFGVGLELYGRDLNAIVDDPQDNGRSQRMASISQGAPQGAQIAGVSRGVSPTAAPSSRPGRPGAAPVAQASTEPTERGPYPYDEIFDNGTRMDAINQYLQECQLATGNMGEAIKTVNNYGRTVHKQTDDIVIGTGDWNDRYRKYDVRPKDIGNALAHWVAQESLAGADEAAAAAERDTKGEEEDDWDSNPF